MAEARVGPGSLPQVRSRVLTPAERLLVRGLLAGHPPVAGVTGLPRSTQNAAIARMYVHDWIRDRYIPNPSVSGWTWVTFAIALPYADKVTVTARGWGDQEGAALLWSSQRTLFGVFFSRTSAEREGLRRILSDRSAAPATIVLQQDLNKAPTPVYIDFEAAWSRVARTEWTVAYPRVSPVAIGRIQPTPRLRLGN